MRLIACLLRQWRKGRSYIDFRQFRGCSCYSSESCEEWASQLRPRGPSSATLKTTSVWYVKRAQVVRCDRAPSVLYELNVKTTPAGQGNDVNDRSSLRACV